MTRRSRSRRQPVPSDPDTTAVLVASLERSRRVAPPGRAAECKAHRLTLSTPEV